MVIVGKKLCLFIVLIIATVCLVGCGGGAGKSSSGAKPSSAAAPAGSLKVEVLDVGQGDAILIRTASQTVLIDTSDLDEHEKFRNALRKAGVKTIDKLIITHPHADHLGGASVLFKEFEVKEVFDNGLPGTQKFYLNYLKEIKNRKIKYGHLYEGDVLDLGDGARFAVLSPSKSFIKDGAKNKKGKTDINGSSIVGRLVFGDFAMMLTGDIEKEGEAFILSRKSNKNNLKCQVLKVGHHGSKTSSSAKFLEAVKPEIAIISCGANNDYKHPHEPALERLNKAGVKKIYRTDEVGTVTIVTDGKGKPKIKGER